MSIRLARFADHWRRALARNYEVRYERLDYRGLRSLHDDSISFAKGITAIVGGNGVGKSTLAHAAVDVLAGFDGVRSLSDRSVRLTGGDLRAQVASESGTQHVSLTVSTAGAREAGHALDAEFTWLDPASMAMLCQRQILGDPAFDDLLESIGSRVLTADELDSASYVVGKDYTKCEVWEIPDYGSFDVLPYFRVTSSGAAYGSEDMGSGELALLITLWTLNRVPKNSIVVLEEPETHVSARSQDALMDLVAWACDRRGLWLVITTHSPIVLRKLPLDHVRLLVVDGGKTRLICEPRLHQLASILGGGVAYRNLLLVEDECARFLVLAILEKLDADLRHQFSIVVASGGEARITAVLRELPRVEQWSIVGCYDGDMRGRIDAKGFEWPHVYLPGDRSPEVLLREAVRGNAAPAKLATALHVSVENVNVALNASAGHDHHDWLDELSRALTLDKGNVVRALTNVWLQVGAADAKTFTEDLRRAVG
jgi:hypothetical protein